MMEMVERVARAWEKASHEWHRTPNPPEGHDITCAHAAIQAMREPTPMMLSIGGVELTEDGVPMPCLAAEVWQQMIDAALADTKAEG